MPRISLMSRRSIPPGLELHCQQVFARVRCAIGVDQVLLIGAGLLAPAGADVLFFRIAGLLCGGGFGTCSSARFL